MADEEYLDVFPGAKRSGNTRRGNGLGRIAVMQTRQCEPSGSERVKTAHCLPGRCFASVTACRNGLNAI